MLDPQPGPWSSQSHTWLWTHGALRAKHGAHLVEVERPDSQPGVGCAAGHVLALGRDADGRHGGPDRLPQCGIRIDDHQLAADAQHHLWAWEGWGRQQQTGPVQTA